MSNDENIHTWLKNISRELASESERMKNLDSYDGNMFTKKKYNVVLQGEKYGLGTNIPNDCPAIYIFYSEKEIVNIEPSFNEVGYGSKANLKEDRSKKFIYLGKSYTIKKRIDEHLSSDESSPYSLKYNHEKRKDVLKGTVLYIFELKEEFKGYKEVILSTIETNLHISCEPLVGSRRV